MHFDIYYLPLNYCEYHRETHEKNKKIYRKMKSNIGMLLLFLICWKTENVHTDKVIVGDFEIQEPLGDELIEDFDENDFLIRG